MPSTSKSSPEVLVLASGSPRRRELLAGLGIPFEVVAPRVREIENALEYGLTPSETAWHNALAKATWAAKARPGCRILGADTVVALGARIFGKPRNRAEARATLSALSGRTHEVLTAVVLLQQGFRRGFVEVSEVAFRTLTVSQIDDYLAKVHVLDKAGAYALQEAGEALIREVQGSVTNVIGLPVERVGRLLRGLPLAANSLSAT
jgi:septum formation protein